MWPLFHYLVTVAPVTNFDSVTQLHFSLPDIVASRFTPFEMWFNLQDW
jgi:hypothetical protein